jgi:hypothetical protein
VRAARLVASPRAREPIRAGSWPTRSPTAAASPCRPCARRLGRRDPTLWRGPRETVAGPAFGGIAVAALVGWRRGWGGLDAGALGGATDAPVLAALPALVGILVAAVAVTVVPVILRRLAGSTRRRSLHVRLALLSLARDPVRPAATITLLAFGIGGLVFALTDAATLRRGISDHAAYAVGADLRITEAAPD